MAKFTYNNVKNASTGHISFKLNFVFYLQMLYEAKVDSCFKFKSADEISAKLRELMIIFQKNLHYAQEA